MTHLESELNNAVKSINRGSRPLNLKVIGLCLGLFAAWAYTGFMGPNALLSGFIVHSQCIAFAKEKKIFKGTTDIEATNLRIRHSAWVVDLFAREDTDLKHRTCVVDGQTILLASMLQDWMYK